MFIENPFFFQYFPSFFLYYYFILIATLLRFSGFLVRLLQMRDYLERYLLQNYVCQILSTESRDQFCIDPTRFVVNWISQINNANNAFIWIHQHLDNKLPHDKIKGWQQQHERTWKTRQNNKGPKITMFRKTCIKIINYKCDLNYSRTLKKTH